ncbi:MAG TPA: MBL fold metallo-hydrolase [Anaerolineaceae bacterium]
MEKEYPVVYTCEHFDLRQLAEGVFAALAREEGAAYSNAGIIDLGDRTLVFDALDSHLASEPLRRAAFAVTGREADTLLISHFHGDHVRGMQVFRGAAVISTHETRRAIQAQTAEIIKMQQNPGEIEAQLAKDEASLQAETDPDKCAALLAAIRRSRFNLQALPGFIPTLPNQTFDGSLTFHGTRRVAEFVTRGKGHTPSDAYLWLPAEKIVFLGDLGFFGNAPFMASCEPAAWVAQMEAMQGWEVDIFVPGHGPLGSKADLTMQREYVLALDAMVSGVIRAGGTLETALQTPLPEKFNGWTAKSARRFEMNVRSAFRRLSPAIEEK